MFLALGREHEARGAFCEDLEAADGVGGVEADGVDFFTARDDIGRRSGKKWGTCETTGKKRKLLLAGRPGARDGVWPVLRECTCDRKSCEAKWWENISKTLT